MGTENTASQNILNQERRQRNNGMKRCEQQLLEALSCFLHGKKSGNSIKGNSVNFKENTAEDWRALYYLSNIHGVFPMVFEVIYPEASAVLPPDETAFAKQTSMRCVCQQAVKSEAFAGIYRRINEAGLKVILVKGAVCRSLYPKPDFRMSGDEDLYVEPDSFEKVHLLFQAAGLKTDDSTGQDNVITYVSGTTGLKIELHKSLFPMDSAAYGKLNNAFRDVFSHAVRFSFSGVPVWTMAPEDHMLYLIYHAFKHFLHSGFGIRQVCDIALYAEAYHTEIDWKRLFDSMKSFQADVFAVNLFEIARKYLDFALPYLQPYFDAYSADISPDDLLKDILSGGIYGKSSEERQHSSLFTINAVSGKSKAEAGKAAGLAVLFPGVDVLRGRYQYLNRRPYLLPVAWGQRIFRYLKTNSSVSAKESVDIGSRRVRLLTKYKIL